jgi:hypothetical protein
VLLFAAVHWLLLRHPNDALALWYPNLATRRAAPPEGDPLDSFRAFCDRHADALAELLATRSTQTNEIGRTALLVPALGLIERELGPLALVDVGASAGLNLLIPHYDYVYDPGGQLVAGSAVLITCGTRGRAPVPANHPAITVAIGVDASPLDVTDRDQALWLEACVWPDHVDRFERLRRAITIATDVGVDVRAGDAVASLGALVTEAAASGHPVITTTWVMNYLPAQQRCAFVAEAERAANAHDLTWIYAESPALCPELPGVPTPRPGPQQPTVLVVARWRDGRLTTTHLADCHPHGRWLHWVAAGGPT